MTKNLTFLAILTGIASCSAGWSAASDGVQMISYEELVKDGVEVRGSIVSTDIHHLSYRKPFLYSSGRGEPIGYVSSDLTVSPSCLKGERRVVGVVGIVPTTNLYGFIRVLEISGPGGNLNNPCFIDEDFDREP